MLDTGESGLPTSRISAFLWKVSSTRPLDPLNPEVSSFFLGCFRNALIRFIHLGHFHLVLLQRKLSVGGIVLPAIDTSSPFDRSVVFFPGGATIKKHLLGGHGSFTVNGIDLVKIAGRLAPLSSVRKNSRWAGSCQSDLDGLLRQMKVEFMFNE